MTCRHITLILALSFAMRGLAQPVITGFTPTSGPIGTTVTINGSGFSATTSADLVTFAGIRANVVSATSTSLTVTVPKGATYKPLVVETGGLAAISTGAFDVTFPGGGVPFAAGDFVSSGVSGTSGLVSGLADLNGDGKMDLYSVSGFTQGLLVSLNTTTGHTVSFSGPFAFNTASTTHSSAAAGDIDGDGKPDIVVGNVDINTFSVFRNTSSGGGVSFATNVDFAVAYTPGEIAIGDVNGDGKPDVVIADQSVSVLSVFINTSTPGTMSFAAEVDVNPGSVPLSVSVTDLDGDGKGDLVLGTAAGLGAMRNTGSIAFGPFVNCGTGTWLVNARAGDLNGDGKPELIATDLRGSTILVVPNNSTPGTLSFGTTQTITCAANTSKVDIDDMDGDGKPDLVSSNINYTNVSIFRNTGSSGSIAFAAPVDYLVGNVSLSTSAVADIDGNGRPDILGNGLVYLNMIGAAPPTITSYTPTAGVTGTVVTITGTNFTTADAVSFGGVAAQSYTINSNTQITAVVGGGASGSLTVDNADATATALVPFAFYPPRISSFTPAIGGSGTAVTIFGSNFANITGVSFGNDTAASFTVDSLGGITAIVGAGQTGDITVTSPNGTSSLPGFSYDPPVISSFSPASGSVGTIVTITGQNFVADTTAEIVRFGAVKATILSSSATQIQVRVPAGAGYAPPSVTINDGRTACASGFFVVTWPGDDRSITDSSFLPAADLTTLSGAMDLAVKDWDGDGHPDIVVFEKSSDDFSVLLNNSTIGTVKFLPRVDFYAGPSPIHMAVRDMNGDGKPDVLILSDDPTTYYNCKVTVFPNASYPDYLSFADQTSVLTTTGTRGICVADINGDALPDIIVSNPDSATITVYPNTTYYGGYTLSFGGPIVFPALGHPGTLLAVDVDADGRPDIVAADSAGNTLAVYKNISVNGGFALAAGVSQGAASAYVAAGDLTTSGVTLISGQNANSAAVADLNGDGLPDVGFGYNGTGSISLWTNGGSAPGSFTPLLPFAIAAGASGPATDTYFYTNDLDGDSKPDAIVLTPGQNSIEVLRNRIGDPVILGVSPDTAYKGTVVQITGRNLTGATSVGFGGVPADSLNVVSAGLFDAVVGPGASGNVVVTTLYGIDSIPGFVFIPQIIPEGDTVFCKGSSVVLRSTAEANNQWFRNGVSLGQDTVQTADSAGAYTVQTTSAWITTISPVLHTVLKTVPTPVITDSAGWLVSSIGVGNQWYFDGGFWADTNRLLRPGPAGTYTVTTLVEGCVSDTSGYYFWGGAASIPFSTDDFIQYYPNPVTNYLVVSELVHGQPILLDLTLMDAAGHILTTVRQTTGGIINVGTFAPGVLLLRVQGSGVDKTVEVLKVK